MKIALRSLLAIALLLAPAARAGRLVNGVLMARDPATGVERPFFPYGAWGGDADAVARLGMNTIIGGCPGNESQVETYRTQVRDALAHGVRIMPFIDFGTGPIDSTRLRAVKSFAADPEFLAFYTGDDITEILLSGTRRNAQILRSVAPHVPLVADYIGNEVPEAAATYRTATDIRSNYIYPVPGSSLYSFRTFFDKQRAFMGDPLWTVLQVFQWESTGELLHLGLFADGPIPEASQVRAMAFIALERGGRGLTFWPYRAFERRPDLALEAEVLGRETRLFTDHLAAGTRTYDLAVSDTAVKATAMRYGRSTLVAATLIRPDYHRWIDEAVVRDLAIEVPWDRSATLPKAALVATPDVVECRVEAGSRPGFVRVAVPSFELAGFIWVTPDANEIAALKPLVAAIADSIGPSIVLAASEEITTAKHALWSAGHDHLSGHTAGVTTALAHLDLCAAAVANHRYAVALRERREANRAMRGEVDALMRDLEAKREAIPEAQRKWLLSPHSVRLIDRLPRIPAPGDKWNFVRGWRLAGPFPLEWDGEWTLVDGSRGGRSAPGYDRVFPPERDPASAGPFATVDGSSGWKTGEVDPANMLDLRAHFTTRDNVVAYAKVAVVAPRDTTMTMSVGTNDGAKIWVNGERVFALGIGRDAQPHQDAIPIRLRAGENLVVVKSINFGSGWKLYCSFDDPTRALRYALPE